MGRTSESNEVGHILGGITCGVCSVSKFNLIGSATLSF